MVQLQAKNNPEGIPQASNMTGSQGENGLDVLLETLKSDILLHLSLKTGSAAAEETLISLKG